MFSYTDDAIVTSSPTGRHLSTVIRRPAAIGPLDWNDHAEQVCKVLNELDSKAKANSLSLHLQTVGRVKRIDKLREQYAEVIKRGFAQDAAIYGAQSPLSFGAGGPIQSDATYRLGEATPEQLRVRTELMAGAPVRSAYVHVEATGQTAKLLYAETVAGARIAELEKQLDDATTKLAAAQKPVELPIETAALRVLLENVGTGSLLHCKAPCGRTVIIKRVE